VNGLPAWIAVASFATIAAATMSSPSAVVVIA